VLRTPPDIDLTRRDAQGNFVQLPDSSYIVENPAWRQGTRDYIDRRYRTQINTDVRFNPLTWLNFSGNLGYDRFEGNDQRYIPKGTPNSVTNLNSTDDGSLDLGYDWTDRFNGGLSVNITRLFRDLTTRTTLRAQYEFEQAEGISADGDDFSVEGVRDLSWVTQPSVGSSSQETRTLGYYLQTGFDYAGKYIADFVVRRDGSSRFGLNERWHTYGRAALAWRMGQEAWWPFRTVTEFKPRYAVGIAGNPPPSTASMTFGDRATACRRRRPSATRISNPSARSSTKPAST
jgi:hypothetical protein